MQYREQDTSGGPAKRRYAGRCSGVPKTGFTLIELLVVVAIIGILISLLFPILGAVRNQTNRLDCTSKQRYLMTTLTLYSEDFRNLPPQNDGVGGTPWYAPKFLGRYLQRDLTKRPTSDVTSPLRCRTPASEWPLVHRTPWIGYNWAFNSSHWGRWDSTQNPDTDIRYLPGKSLQHFRNPPAKVPTFVDARSSAFLYMRWAYNDGRGLDYITGQREVGSPYDPRHDGDETGGANFAFADGSVRYLRNVDEAFLSRNIILSPVR